MDTKIRSDVRADPPSAWAFPEIKQKQSLKKKTNNHHQQENLHMLQQVSNLYFKKMLR